MTPNRELLPIASTAETRRAVWVLIRPQRLFALVTFVVLVAGTVIGLVGPAILGRIVDLVTERQPSEAIIWPVALLILVAVGQAALSAAGAAMVARLGETILATLRERVVERALELPVSQVEQAGSGDVIARVAGDVAVIAEAVRESLPLLTSSALTVSLTVVGMVVLDWRFALAGLCATPIQIHTLRWYLRKSSPLYAAERVAEGERAQQLLDSISGAATVRAYRLSPAHIQRVSDRSQVAVDFALRTTVLRTRFFARLNFAEYVGLSAILAVGFFLVRNDTVTIGAATAAALYFHRLFDPIGSLLLRFDKAQEAAAGLARLVGIANLPEPEEPEHPVKPADTSIRVTGVRHRYTSGHEVLHGVDLEVPPGWRVALVGASGAGKTTLAKLISGFHQPTEGEITLGGVQHDELGPALTRRTVALITQEVHVFAGTLAEDLRLARPDATDDQLIEALDRVGASSWALALPDGLDTVVGDGGHRLTASQAQQLALARLVLADPPIVILDEATAEAGSRGARTLETAADRALEGRTALVVAHRLTQATTADRIVVLDDGRVVESGDHESLVAAGGRYAALWVAWSRKRFRASTNGNRSKLVTRRDGKSSIR